MRTGVFVDRISKEIMGAYLQSIAKYRMVCRREDNRLHVDQLQYADFEHLQRLAARLNKRFPRRHYYVERIEQVQV